MTMCLYHEHTAEVQAEHQAYRFAPKMSLLYQTDCQNRCSCPDGYHSGHTHQEFRHGRKCTYVIVIMMFVKENNYERYF